MFYSTIEQAPFVQVVKRVLAASADEAPLDYTVLSVAVITLGLILVVELIRHRLDVAATGRPFFKTVLEGVYRELATLGCVEFFVFILHKYYSGLNIEQELVFADVHFTLFFTALFNAFQSCLLAFWTVRVSQNQWVRTEQVEVDHYVEIREEFDRVEALLYGASDDLRRSTALTSSHATNDDEGSESSFSLDMNTAEIAFEFNCRGVSRSCSNMRRFIRYPHLFKKHQKLLVQIRFHELRLLFLQSNNLPYKFKVSDYLMRSELMVLIKLVHISTFAWLMLMGGVTLIYYFMGIVIYVTEDLRKVGLSLTWIFMGSMIFSVVVSLLIYNKMKWIFSEIMRKRLTTEVESGRKEVSTRSGQEKKITSQKDLFWGGNPKFVRSIIQFMQFGFALALSILLVFWKDITSQYPPVQPWGILLCVLGCYAAFVAIISQVLPRYTLCTSLGQLVDKDRLQETLAQQTLEDEQRRQARRKEIELEDEIDASSWDMESIEEVDNEDDASSKSSSVVLAPIVKASAAAKKVFSEGFHFKKKTEKPSKTFEDIDFQRKAQSEHFTTATGSWDIGDKKANISAPIVPAGDNSTMSREERMRKRKERRKSQSVGVAVMRNLGQMTAAAADAATPKGGHDKAPRNHERHGRSLSGDDVKKMRRSLSGEDVKKMRRTSSFEQQLMAQLIQTDTKELRKKASIEIKANLSSREERMQARRNRTKSTSDGVALMRSVMEADRKELMNPASKVMAAPIATATSANTQRRERRRSLSAAANIQHMRDMTLSSEEPPLMATMRKPRSRQSSGLSGVAVLEPLVEGVAADHSGSTLNVVESVDSETDHAHENGGSKELQTQSHSGSASTLGSEGKETKVTEEESVVTFDDEHSTYSDIPVVDKDAPEYQEKTPEPSPTLSEILRRYFLSQKYRLISAVFGTVLCFFLVGMRMEALLISSCVMPDNENTWHIEGNTTFWMETAWLSCFIGIGFYNAFIFRPGHVYSNKERSRFISAVLDIILSSTCLILLMLAESRRCCPDATQRFLAGEDENAEWPYDCEAKYGSEEWCCPSFGNRVYGGLGNIEPCTAIVVLRLLRFRIATRFVTFMDRRRHWSDVDVAATTEKNADESLHPFHPLYSKMKSSNLVDRKKSADTEAAIELWMKAIAARPDLAKPENGEFSSEILQVMLGLDVPYRSAGVPSYIEPRASEQNDSDLEDEKESEARLSNAEMEARRKSVYASTRREVDVKYPHLSPEARSMLVSTKLAKTPLVGAGGATGPNVKPTAPPSAVAKPPSALKSSLAFQPKQNVPQLAFAPQSKEPPATTKVQFDLSPPVVESKETVAQFVAPNARLIRSIRRCDRKLLPLLDKWTIVDVVLTKYEIVYLDATDVDGPYGPEYSSDDIKHITDTRKVSVATKGGKGLRLSDVAKGRKVVGHLDLAKVETIHVERIMPPEDEGQPNEPSSDASSDVRVELWKASKKSDEQPQLPRAERWGKVKQDLLEVKSGFSTLILRFYSDLEDSENNPERCADERESDGPLFKDNAFQWCQTIGRLCGPNQLAQKLPHFGEDNDEELRDYLVVNDTSTKTFQEHPRHMRRKSFGNLFTSVTGNVLEHAPFLGMLAEDVEVSEPKPPPHGPPKQALGRRISSFGPSSEELKNKPARAKLRRLSSTGDIPSTRELKSIEELSSSAPPVKQKVSKDDSAATFGGVDMV